MRKLSDQNNNFPPILEDPESGIDMRDSENNKTIVYDTLASSKSTLPKGSVTFQQVLDEIKKEKEAERALIEKTLNAFATAKKRPSVNGDEKSTRNNKWKMASFRMLSRSRSQRESISK